VLRTRKEVNAMMSILAYLTTACILAAIVVYPYAQVILKAF
jgi:hypothetical protein